MGNVEVKSIHRSRAMTTGMARGTAGTQAHDLNASDVSSPPHSDQLRARSRTGWHTM